MKFDRFAQWLANLTGRPLTFGLALLLILIRKQMGEQDGQQAHSD